MTKIRLLLTASLLTLAGCASTSQPAQPQRIQTEAPGYFSKEWMKSLQIFKAGLESLSKDATNSTSTQSGQTQ